MALLLVASQKRLGVGGSSGTVGSAVTEPWLSSKGFLPSLGSAPAIVVSPWPLMVGTVVVESTVVDLGMDDEIDTSSIVGTRAKRTVKLLELKSQMSPSPDAIISGETATVLSPLDMLASAEILLPKMPKNKRIMEV